MRVNINDVSFGTGGETLAGRLYSPIGVGGAEPRPAAVLVHGLGSGQGAMRGGARDLARRGVVALTFDERGHGKSTGAYTGDSSTDVRAAVQFLGEQDGVDAARVAIVGHSSGARDAILACARWDGFAALVCSSTAGIIGREEPGAAEGILSSDAWESKAGAGGRAARPARVSTGWRAAMDRRPCHENNLARLEPNSRL